MKPYGRIELEKWLDSLAHLFVGSIVDIGSGGHTYISKFKSESNSFLFTDVYPKFGYRILNLEAPLEADLTHAFDVVVCNQVLEHCFNPWQSIETLLMLAKPKGTLLISTPFNFGFHKDDFYRFTPLWFKRVLAEACSTVEVTIKPENDNPVIIMVKATKK